MKIRTPEEQGRFDNANRVLHTGVVDGKPFTHPELKEEFKKLTKWWGRACHSVNYDSVDEILREEAEYALSWCEFLTVYLVDAEQAYRKNQPLPSYLEVAREIVWDRFNNLEAGLKSNGVERK